MEPKKNEQISVRSRSFDIKIRDTLCKDQNNEIILGEVLSLTSKYVFARSIMSWFLQMVAHDNRHMCLTNEHSFIEPLKLQRCNWFIRIVLRFPQLFEKCSL